MALFDFKNWRGKKQGASPARRAREQRRVSAHAAIALPVKAAGEEE